MELSDLLLLDIPDCFLDYYAVGSSGDDRCLHFSVLVRFRSLERPVHKMPSFQNADWREADRFPGMGVARPVVQKGITWLDTTLFQHKCLHPGLLNLDCCPHGGTNYDGWQGWLRCSAAQSVHLLPRLTPVTDPVGELLG